MYLFLKFRWKWSNLSLSCFEKKKCRNSIVLIICCCVTTYYKFRDLKQCRFITSQYLWVRSLVVALIYSQQGDSQGVCQTEPETLLGKDKIPSSLGCWWNSWLGDCGTQDHRQSLPVAWTMFCLCHVALSGVAHNLVACYLIASKGKGSQEDRCYVIVKMTSFALAVFYSFGSNSWPPSRGGGYRRMWRPRRGLLGPPYRWFTHPLILKVPQRHYCLVQDNFTYF